MMFRLRKIRIHLHHVISAILTAGIVCGQAEPHYQYFEIKSQLSSDEELCLQPKTGFSFAKESKLILKVCNGWNNQKWRVDTSGQFHSKADDSKCVKKVWRGIKISDCNSEDLNLKFGFDVLSDAVLPAINFFSHTFTIQGVSPYAGNEVKFNEVTDGNIKQKWNFVPGLSGSEDLYREIKPRLPSNQSQDLCLHPKAGFPLVPGSKLILKACNGWEMQKWMAKDNGQIYSKVDSTKCLKKIRRGLRIGNCNGNDQKYKFGYDLFSDILFSRSKDSFLVLTVQGVAPHNGSEVRLGKRIDGNPAQKWKLDFEVTQAPTTSPTSLFEAGSYNVVQTSFDGVKSYKYFGYSVSLSSNGDILVITNPGEDSTYVLSKVGSSWLPLGSALTGPGNLFGTSSAISSNGNIVAVGGVISDGTPPNRGQYAGAVRVFKWENNSSWVLHGNELTGDAYQAFGADIALSENGETLLVCADGDGASDYYCHHDYPYYDIDECDYPSGYCSVFDFVDSMWVQRGSTIKLSVASDYSIDGSISGSGNMVVIGFADANYVGIYDWDGGSWKLRGDSELKEPLFRKSYSFGSDVAIARRNQNVLAVGGALAGEVYVYEWNGARWELRGGAPISTGISDSGWSIEISGDGSIVAIGSDESGTNVYVTKWNGRKWNLMDAKIEGGSFTSIALSDDGKTMAVGLPFIMRIVGQATIYEWKD